LKKERSMNVTIVADEGTHLLVACDQRYAVIERRNNRLYNCHGDKRDGIPATDMSAIGQILNDNDWISKEAAQTMFDDIVERGKGLAQRML
jgi:hypothetical protein